MVSKAVLFASADGHRSSAPLALLPVGNRPLVLHALDDLFDAGIEDVSIVSEAAVAEQVEQVVAAAGADGRASHLTVDEDCTFIGALRTAAAEVRDERFVVHLGDSLSQQGLESAVAEPPQGPNDAVALVEGPGNDVTPLGAGLASLQAAGVYVFGRGILELSDEPAPSGRWDVQIAAATDRLAESGGELEIRLAPDWWRYQQRPDILLQANRYFLGGISPAPTQAWLENTDLQGPVLIDATARLRSTTVRGPAVIGPGVEISDAYIGPYTSIGPGVVIENAEVEHSILLPGASVRHLGGRLEASVVGAGARVFRDFRLPRAFRLNVGENAEVALT
jgi:glucose-1-phosphate thymidylyltransferase